MQEKDIHRSFENKIWEAACILRGHMDATQYKHIVLGLIFLKFIDSQFEEKFNQLKAYGLEEQKAQYKNDNVFFVPPLARWDYISQFANAEEIGDVIDQAMTSVEAENEELKGILPQNFSGLDFNPRPLGDVVTLFNSMDFSEKGHASDILGRVYEYCLSRFARQEGKLAGEFYTPFCVVKTLVDTLKPFEGKVYDPCCGSGGMFVQSARFLQKHRKGLDSVRIYGQDANPFTWKLCKMNLAIRGIKAELGTGAADTFREDLHKGIKVDYILANPPFNLSGWSNEAVKEDVRFSYGIPPEGNANFAWLQHMVHHLGPCGKAGVVLANGSLSSRAGGEGVIRRNLVDADLVEGIVSLPPHLFYTTPIPVSLWFLNKNKTRKNKVLFIDAKRMGSMVDRRLRELSDQEIQTIVNTFEVYQKGGDPSEKGFCAVTDIKEIAAQDYMLTPARYVGILEEQDTEPFQEKINRLTEELSELMQQGKVLESEIKKNLTAFGFNAQM